MALTNPTKKVTVERLQHYNTKDKAARATEISTAVNAEKTARQTADTTLQGNIDTITGKIPSAATSTNKLVDEAAVNAKISTAEATFRGNFGTKALLDAYTGAKDKNDTAIVDVDETHSDQCSMYQYDGTNWVYKYKQNNKAFTPAQQNAIDSGITATKVTSYDTHIADKANPHEVALKQTVPATTMSANIGKAPVINSSGTDFEYVNVSECSDADIDEIFA